MTEYDSEDFVLPICEQCLFVGNCSRYYDDNEIENCIIVRMCITKAIAEVDLENDGLFVYHLEGLLEKEDIKSLKEIFECVNISISDELSFEEMRKIAKTIVDAEIKKFHERKSKYSLTGWPPKW